MAERHYTGLFTVKRHLYKKPGCFGFLRKQKYHDLPTIHKIGHVKDFKKDLINDLRNVLTDANDKILRKFVKADSANSIDRESLDLTSVIANVDTLVNSVYDEILHYTHKSMYLKSFKYFIPVGPTKDTVVTVSIEFFVIIC